MSMQRFFIFLVLTVALSLLIFFRISPRTSSATLTTVQDLTINKIPSNYKTILYWNKLFNQKNFYLGDGYFTRHCPRYNNCFATSDRLLHNSVDNFDAIIFHGYIGKLDPNDLPNKRHPDQQYVYFGLESPANYFITQEYDGYFNTTMTYNLDSDIVHTYADVVDQNNERILIKKRDSKNDTVSLGKWKEEEKKKLMKIIGGKKKLAVWYRSNCAAKSGREEYVIELEKYVKVDKYGKCSKNQGCSKLRQDCFKVDVEPNYFFYLAFENSLCDDYVTEKFFNTLDYNVVPVVYGGANYSIFAPPHSYIDVLDFDSPKHLAKYLLDLSKNTSEYLKYFDWKRRYRVIPDKKRVVCDLCALLNSEHRKTYTISKWFNMNRCPLQTRLNKQVSSGGVKYATKTIRDKHILA